MKNDFTLDYGWGHLTDKGNPRACKVRLSQIFRGDKNLTETMQEIKTLTEPDLADFRVMFEAAGYPCT